jgi:uncharacterized damage-inducible protein DinB
VDNKELLQHQFGISQFMCGGAFQDITDEQLNWTPPGTANSIGATLLHMYGGEDTIVQGWLRHQPTIWESEGWSGRVGLAEYPARGQGWDEVAQVKLSVATVLAYAQTVRAATEAYLASLSAEDLDRIVPAFGREVPVADVLSTVVVHSSLHTGEVAVLKGIQGARGLPA